MLAPHEPHPVIAERLESDAPVVVTVDHAGNAIPEVLGDIGLDAAARARHIAWDIGALGVARELAALLGAPLVAQHYSRLVVDCNRPAAHPEVIPARSEATDIPGNVDLTEAAREQRLASIYRPYHDILAQLLDARERRGRATVFVAVHSFTPVYHGEPRPWHVGVLYGHDARLAKPLLEHFGAAGELCVGDNEPYRIDEKDAGIPVHALARGLHNVLLEIRQDLIERERGQRDWGQRVAAGLRAALGELGL